MRKLISWFRSLFCKHDFLYEEKKYNKLLISPLSWIKPKVIGDEIRVSRTCKKCGWHTSYIKF